MKKILSVALALIMVLSLAVVFATTVSAAEEENMWTVLTHGDEYLDDFFGERTSVPGYYYDSEGFHTYGGEWKADGPYQHVQTNRKVNLKDGVFMEVRVDEFDYNAGDKWFNFNIWNSVGFEPGSNDERLGEGVQTILRPSTPQVDGELEYVNHVQWNIEQFSSGGYSYIDEENRTSVEKDGQTFLTLALTITWEGWTYAVDINGVQAPDETIAYMNETFSDGMAYIGFAMHSSAEGGAQSCTVTRFGTDSENAKAPKGTDAKDPENYDNTPAPIQDPSNVPEGQPAIFMSGDRANSHLQSLPTSMTGGSIISVSDENYIHINALRAISDCVMSVDKDISFAVEDFPIMLALTKNLCTCGMGTHADCMALESMKCYIMAGEVVYPEPNHEYRYLEICYNPYLIHNDSADDDNYLTFMLDLSDTEETGRINGVRLDASGIDLKTTGFNEYDICWVGFFRTEDEAITYAEDYLYALGYDEESQHPGYEPEPEPEPQPEIKYGTIEEGEWITLPTYGGVEHIYYYEFTPKYTGTYWYHTINNESISFLNYDHQTISQSKDGTSATAYLRAGETYYLYANLRYGDSCEIIVEPLPQKTRYEMSIYEGSTYLDISVPGDYYDLVFVPKTSGMYCVNTSWNADLIMYDEAQGVIARSETMLNCTFTNNHYGGYGYELVAGNKYYFRAKKTNKAGIGDLDFAINLVQPLDMTAKQPDYLLTPDEENSYLSHINDNNTEAGKWYVTEDNTVKLVANQTIADFGTWIPDSPISFDNGVIMCMTKNFCTCGMDAHSDCMALESVSCYLTVNGEQRVFKELEICYYPCVIGEDNYLIFWIDSTRDGYELQGTIESITIEARGIDLKTEGFNGFELCWIGFFDSVEDGEAFADSTLYIGDVTVKYEYIEGDFFTMEDNNGDVIIDTNTPGTEDPTDPEETTTPEDPIDPDTDTDTDTEREPGYEPEEIYDYIDLGDTVTVEIANGGEEYYFEFTPDKNGNYYFYSVGDISVYGEILDEDGNLLVAGESDDGINFVAKYAFKKGKTYYLRTGTVGGEIGEYEIQLQRKKPNSSSNKADKAEKDEEQVTNNVSCSMSVGLGGIAIMAVSIASCGIIVKRRKDEE